MAEQSRGILAGRVRFLIVTMLFLASALNYADRSSLGVAKDDLKREFKIDNQLFATIILVWGVAYVLAQIPSGRLLDRYGTKRVYGFALLAWSVLEMFYGFVHWLPNAAAVTWALLAITFLLGLMEAPAFPGNARIVAQWFPTKERGTASAYFNSSQYFAMVAFGPLMGTVAHFMGWPWIFWIMGGIGILLVVVWFIVIHPPREHPWISEAELDHISKGGALVDVTHGKSTAKKGWFYARQLLFNRMLIGIYLGQFCITTLTFFYTQWIIPFLKGDRGLSILNAGFIAALPHICGFIGGLLGGIFSDFLLRRGYSLTAARKTPIVIGMAISATIVLCNYATETWVVVAILSFAFFGKGFGALGWVVVSDTAPKQVLGLAGGIFNTFGNSAQVALALFVGNFVTGSGKFDAVIWYVGGCAVVAMLSYMFLVGKIDRVVLKEPAEPSATEVVKASTPAQKNA